MILKSKWDFFDDDQTLWQSVGKSFHAWHMTMAQLREEPTKILQCYWLIGENALLSSKRKTKSLREEESLSKTRSLVQTKKLVIYQPSSHDNGSKGSAKYLILLSFVITAKFSACFAKVLEKNLYSVFQQVLTWFLHFVLCFQVKIPIFGKFL